MTTISPGHLCRNYPSVITRVLKSGAQVLVYQCRHLELRQRRERWER